MKRLLRAGWVGCLALGLLGTQAFGEEACYCEQNADTIVSLFQELSDLIANQSPTVKKLWNQTKGKAATTSGKEMMSPVPTSEAVLDTSAAVLEEEPPLPVPAAPAKSLSATPTIKTMSANEEPSEPDAGSQYDNPICAGTDDKSGLWIFDGPTCNVRMRGSQILPGILRNGCHGNWTCPVGVGLDSTSHILTCHNVVGPQDEDVSEAEVACMCGRGEKAHPLGDNDDETFILQYNACCNGQPYDTRYQSCCDGGVLLEGDTRPDDGEMVPPNGAWCVAEFYNNTIDIGYVVSGTIEGANNQVRIHMQTGQEAFNPKTCGCSINSCCGTLGYHSATNLCCGEPNNAERPAIVPRNPVYVEVTGTMNSLTISELNKDDTCANHGYPDYEGPQYDPNAQGKCTVSYDCCGPIYYDANAPENVGKQCCWSSTLMQNDGYYLAEECGPRYPDTTVIGGTGGGTTVVGGNTNTTVVGGFEHLYQQWLAEKDPNTPTTMENFLAWGLNGGNSNTPDTPSVREQPIYIQVGNQCIKVECASDEDCKSQQGEGSCLYCDTQEHVCKESVNYLRYLENPNYCLHVYGGNDEGNAGAGLNPAFIRQVVGAYWDENACRCKCNTGELENFCNGQQGYHSTNGMCQCTYCNPAYLTPCGNNCCPTHWLTDRKMTCFESRNMCEWCDPDAGTSPCWQGAAEQSEFSCCARGEGCLFGGTSNATCCEKTKIHFRNGKLCCGEDCSNDPPPPDNCGDVSCGRCEECYDGACYPVDDCDNDPCANVSCSTCQTCVNGSCVAVAGCCTTDGDCGTCQECSNNTCVDKENCCVTNGDCGTCQECSNNTCVAIAGCCTTNGDCGTCQECSNNTCVAVAGCCVTDGDCGTCQECSNNTCVDKENCCVTDSDCGTCQECSNNTCVDKENCCTTDSNCGSCEVCSDNTCVAVTCESCQECDNNHGCQAVTCEDRCQSCNTSTGVCEDPLKKQQCTTPHYSWKGWQETPQCSCTCDPFTCTDSATPDFDLGSCSCICEESKHTCVTGSAKPDFDKGSCSCICEESKHTCVAGSATPDFDKNSCSCTCKKTSSDCSGATPSFDADTCSCVCKETTDTCKAKGMQFDAENCQCVGCLTNEQCGSCQQCQDNSCVVIPGCCTADTDCGLCEVCENDQCQPLSCETCFSCQNDHMCSRIPGCCTTDTDCGGCEVCEENVCKPLSCETCFECKDNRMCSRIEGCCTVDTECGACEVCENNTCKPLSCETCFECKDNHMCSKIEGCCTADTDCPTCEVCENNACKPKQCDQCFECKNDVCVMEEEYRQCYEFIEEKHNPHYTWSTTNQCRCDVSDFCESDADCKGFGICYECHYPPRGLCMPKFDMTVNELEDRKKECKRKGYSMNPQTCECPPPEEPTEPPKGPCIFENCISVGRWFAEVQGLIKGKNFVKEPTSCDCCVEKDDTHPLWDEGKCVKCAAVTSPDGIGFYYDVEYKYGFCCPGEIDGDKLTPEYLKSIEWAFNDDSEILEVKRLIQAYKELIGSYNEEKERCNVQCLGPGKGSCEEEKAKHCLLLRQYEEIIEMLKKEAEELIPMTGVGCEGKVDEEGNPACCQLIDGLYSCGPCKVMPPTKPTVQATTGSLHKRSRFGYRVNRGTAGGQTSALATPTLGKIAQGEELEEDYVRKMGPTCLDDLSCYLRHSLDTCPEGMPHYSFELGRCVSCEVGIECPVERPYQKEGICVECLEDVHCEYDLEGSEQKTKPYCVNNRCAGCRTDVDCGEGSVCRNGVCQVLDCRSQGICPSDKPKCNEQSGICEECNIDSDCGSGLCIDGRCGVCTEDKECAAGLYCIGGQCARCREDIDCGEGRYCRENQCIECRDNSDCKEGDRPLCDYISGICVGCPIELPNWDKEKGVCYGCAGGCRAGCYCDEACGTCHAQEGLKAEMKKYPKTPAQAVNEILWEGFKELFGEQLNENEYSRLKEGFMTALQEGEGNKVLKEGYPYNCARGAEVVSGQGVKYDSVRQEIVLGKEVLSNRYYDPKGLSEGIIKSVRGCAQGVQTRGYYQCVIDMPASSWKALENLMRYVQHMESIEDETGSGDYKALKEEIGSLGAYHRYTRYITNGACRCGQEAGTFSGTDEDLNTYLKRVCLAQEQSLGDVMMRYYTKEALPGETLDVFLTLPDDLPATFLDKAIACKRECSAP